jgi:hypothetical protein
LASKDIEVLNQDSIVEMQKGRQNQKLFDKKLSRPVINKHGEQKEQG